MVKNILVTGGAGYIGSHVCEVLIKNKKNVFIVDDLSTGFKKLINKNCTFFNCNILDKKKIKKIIYNNNIDSIIHLAAALSVGESQKKPKKYLKINVKGTKNILDAIRGSKIKNIIFSSTCAVYRDGLSKVNEKSELKPKSIYGKTKLKGEKLIRSFCKKHKLNYGILRFFNVAGASLGGKIGQISRGDQLFKNLSVEINKKKPNFKIYGNNYKTPDGTCVRDYIHVSDIADIHLKTLMKLGKLNKSVILNCGYSKGVSVKEVVNEFKKYSKKKIILKFLSKRKGDMERITANTAKLKKFLNWRPKYNNLKLIVKSCINWEKQIKQN